MSVKLVSSEGKTIVVKRDVLLQSELLTNMFRDLGYEQGQDVPDPIPLTKVNTEILQKIIQWCAHHKDVVDNMEEGETEERKVMTEWEEQYFKQLGQVDLFEIIQAANYMNVKTLLNFACVSVASMIAGKEPDAIRQQFNIEDDFSPEEKEQTKRESSSQQWNY